MTEHLGPAERFAVGAIGEPGDRTFYIHVVANTVSYWFIAEKGQVAALADYALTALAEANILPDPDGMNLILSRLTLTEPAEEVRFRVGTMSMAIQPESDLMTLEVVSVDGEEGYDFVIAPEQLQAVAIKGFEVVGQGRPICPRCQLPMGPGDHQCPASNGHPSG